MVTLNPRACRSLPNEEAIIPFPKEEVTPPVIKMYFVFEAIRSVGGVEITRVPMGCKSRKISRLGLKFWFGFFEGRN
jgi:hypothetical protein